MSENQLKPELLGLTNANSFSNHNSSSRSVMMGSHMTQSLRTLEADEKRIQSGIEQELSKTTFDIKMPADGTILAVIDKYPSSLGKDSLKFNPETVIVFEREDNNQIDVLVLPHYCSHHQYFGFEYKRTDNVRKLTPNTPITKDTVFATSPAVTENNGYKYGRNFNTAFMSMPAVAEDGFIISKSALDKLKFKVYERRSVDFGSKNIPLNIHGNSEEYKMFPDIGDYTNDVRSDGLLMMLREVTDELAPALMSKDALREPDFTFDKGVYVKAGRGKIIDIEVTSNNNHARNIPPEITEQLIKYEKANITFHTKLLELEASLLKRKRGKYGIDSKLNLSPKLHAMLVEAYAINNTPHNKDSQPLNLLYRQDKIDEFRVSFVIENTLRATIGSKISNMSGGKGVICKIMEDDDMPIDQYGNRAEIVIDPTSIISRINIGSLYEHYFNGVSRDVRKLICESLGLNKGEASPATLSKLDPSLILNAYQTYLKYLSIVSKRQHAFYNDLNDQEKLEALSNIINDDLYTYMPSDNTDDSVGMVTEIEKTFGFKIGPVMYTGQSGNKVTTKTDIRIAPIYFILLDKIADSWSAVATGKLQHFGVLTPITKSEKFALPFKNTATKTCGETEGRLNVGYAGERALAEIMDRSNNPQTQRNIVTNILNANIPTDIDEVVDREHIPYGNGKNLQLVKHQLHCSGIDLAYELEEPQL